jgi:peroxiredoxin
MRPDIVLGGAFPDYELPDHRGKHRTLSELQAGDPLVLVLSRGSFCPKARRQHEGLLQLHREMEVGYCRLVTISTDNLLETNEFRSGVGANWPFLSDPGRKLQKDLDIAEYTDPHHIGDRYRIGSALFEVTQPRVTCYRVGLRMNEPRMPALLTSSGRPGFYFRVLREGEVGAGDELVKVGEAEERMTVAEISERPAAHAEPPLAVPRRRGSSQSRRWSPSRFTARTVAKIARPGKAVSHHAV